MGIVSPGRRGLDISMPCVLNNNACTQYCCNDADVTGVYPPFNIKRYLRTHLLAVHRPGQFKLLDRSLVAFEKLFRRKKEKWAIFGQVAVKISLKLLTLLYFEKQFHFLGVARACLLTSSPGTPPCVTPANRQAIREWLRMAGCFFRLFALISAIWRPNLMKIEL